MSAEMSTDWDDVTLTIVCLHYTLPASKQQLSVIQLDNAQVKPPAHRNTNQGWSLLCTMTVSSQAGFVLPVGPVFCLVTLQFLINVIRKLMFASFIIIFLTKKLNNPNINSKS